jgi:hypothetical protein
VIILIEFFQPEEAYDEEEEMVVLALCHFSWNDLSFPLPHLLIKKNFMLVGGYGKIQIFILKFPIDILA